MKLSVLACLLVVGCGSTPPPSNPVVPEPMTSLPEREPVASATPAAVAMTAPAPEVKKSLYDRLGGLPAIEAVVGEFVGLTTTDPRIKDRFFNTDADNLKKLLVELVCMATGGPCKYTGRDMSETHAGMELVDDEFNALVENLVSTLDKFKVPDAEKGELLGAIGPMKGQIVVPAGTLTPLDPAKLANVTALVAKIKDKAAADLLAMAVIAGHRGQRSYAEQLFTRAEILTGPQPLATVASTFRTGAPPRVTTRLSKLAADTAAQPRTVGGSEADEPDAKPARGSLSGTIQVDGTSPSGLGVVMLWPETGGKKRAPKQRMIEQRNKVFAPHVTAVPVGSTISFPNFDPIYHNVFSLSKSKPFDLGMYKNGESREVKVDKPGIVRLGCNLHASMSGYLVVVDAPHYAIAGEDGSFAFKSLAPGMYKMQVWNERSAAPTTTMILIKEGANTTMPDLKGTASGPSPDKFGGAR